MGVSRISHRFFVAIVSLALIAISMNSAISTRAANESAMFRGNAARTGQHPGPGPEGTPSEQWNVVVDAPVVASPIVVDDTVFVSGWDGVLRALDLANSDERWSIATGALDSAPAVVDGVVYAGGANEDESAGMLYAIEVEDGGEIWRHETAFALSDSSPVVDGGVLYIGGGNGDETAGALYAINAATGDEVWSYDTPMPVWSSPAVADGQVYVGSGAVDADSGIVFALDTENGGELWTFAVADGTVLTAPAVSNGVVFIGSTSLYALDAETGTPLWTVSEDRETFDTSPAIVDGVVFVGGDDLSAHDAKSGDTLWSTDLGAYVASPVESDGMIYVGTYDGDLVAIDASIGDEQWRVTIALPGESGDRVVASSPAVIDGTVYVTSLSNDDDGKGAVHALR